MKYFGEIRTKRNYHNVLFTFTVSWWTFTLRQIDWNHPVLLLSLNQTSPRTNGRSLVVIHKRHLHLVRLKHQKIVFLNFLFKNTEGYESVSVFRDNYHFHIPSSYIGSWNKLLYFLSSIHMWSHTYVLRDYMHLYILWTLLSPINDDWWKLFQQYQLIKKR